MPNDLALRTLAPVNGADAALGTSTGYLPSPMGFALPMVVDNTDHPSDPLVICGLVSFNLFITINVAVAGSMSVDIGWLRPDLTVMSRQTITAINTFVSGTSQINFGTRGRDTNVSGLEINFVAWAFQIILVKLDFPGNPAVTINGALMMAGERM